MKFKAPIEVQAGISDGDPTNPLGQSGYLLSSDGSNVNWVSPGDLSAETAEAIVQPIKANEALSKGDPLYIVGFQAGQNVNIVAKADSSDVAKMPVVGLADDDYANQTFGTMTAFGSFNGDFDTTGGTESWAVGDIIFVKPGGGLTNIKPGGTDLIQNVAIVSRVQSQTGELEVIALGRTNDVPNLPAGRLFVGTAGVTSLLSDVVYIDDTNDRVGIGTDSPAYLLDVNEDDSVLAFRVTGGGGGAPIASFVRDVGATGSQVNINAQSNFPQIQFTNTGNTFSIGGDTSGNFKISDADAIGTNDRITINSSGNVGIGTTSPQSKLHVSSDSDPTIIVGTTTANQANSGKISFRELPSVSEFELRYNGSSNRFDIWNWVGGEAISILRSNSNVGIGTTNPLAKLQVNTGSDINAQFGLDSFGSFKLGDVFGNYIGRGVFYSGSPGSEDLQALTNTFRISGGSGEGIQRVANGDVYLNTQSGVLATLDASTNNFGIGTTTPSGKLEVRQAANNGNTGAFTNTHLKLTASATADNTGFVGITAATSTANNYGYSFGAQRTSGGVGDFKINYHNNSAAGVNRFIIDQDGNVGIGDTDPDAKLTVFRTSTTFATALSTAESRAGLSVKSTSTYDAKLTVSTGISGIQQIQGVNNAATTGRDIAINPYGGNVGIGTTIPGEKLSVAPDTDVSAEIGKAHIGQVGFNDYAGFSHVDQNTQQGYALIQYSDGSTYINANTGKNIRFRIGNSDKMILNSSGNVGIGTTSPQSKLQVNGGVQLANDTASPSASKVGTFRYRTSGNNSYVDMCMQTGASTYAWVNIVQNTW